MKKILFAMLLAAAAVGVLSAQTITRSLGGLEDMSWGSDTFERTVGSTTVELHGFTPVNVLAFDGVDNTGTSYCTEEIQDIFDMAALAGDMDIIFPPGEYLVTSLVLDRPEASGADGGITIYADGAVFTAPVTSNDPILRIGGPGDRCHSVTLYGGAFVFASTNYDSTSSTSTAACLELYNTSNCDFYDVTCANGYEGIRLYADGDDGVTYNTIYSPWIRDCLYGVRMRRGGSSAWINENALYDARVGYSSSLASTDLSTGAAVHISVNSASGSMPNNNMFSSPCFELNSAITTNKPMCVYDEYGNQNQFYAARTEGFDAPVVRLGPSASSMVFEDGYGHTLASDIAGADDIYKMRIATMRQFSFHGGTSTEPVIIAANRSASTGPAIIVRNPAGTVDVATIYSNGDVSVAGDVDGDYAEFPYVAAEDSISTGYVKTDSLTIDGEPVVPFDDAIYLYMVDEYYTVAFAAANADSMIEGWSEEYSSEIVAGAGERNAIIASSGTYLVNWGMTLMLSSGGPCIFRASLAEGNSEIGVSSAECAISGGEYASLSGSAIVELAASDLVGICVRNRTDTSSVQVVHAGLAISRID